MQAPLMGGKKASDQPFGIIVLVVQALIIGVFYNAKYDSTKYDDALKVDQSGIYNIYVGVALMMFVGFGYLMTFLKGYGLGAVGLTMFVTCIGVEFAVIVETFMAKGELLIDFYSILNGNFAIAAVLISFGGLIGKVYLMKQYQSFFFFTKYQSSPLIGDCGGTILIHVFGAYFGLACSKVLGDKPDEALNGSNYVSDLFSLVGTVFLWLYWPSFVSGGLPANSAGQTTAMLNTVLALLSSTVITFAIAPLMNKGKIGTVPIQNATLAGGVAIGATANVVGPFGSMVVGALAGALSTVGFITNVTGDFDTCGINNLHGMPGLLGGVFSIIAPMMYEKTEMVASHQAIGLLITFGVAIVSGGITGGILKAVGSPSALFDDSVFWECADLPKD